MSVAQKRVCFTGVRLSPLEGHGGVSALVVGEDCLLSGGYAGNVLEWPLSKLQAAVNAAKPHVTETPADCWLESRRDATQYCWIKCMQGLGEGPAGAMVSEMDGKLCLVKRGKTPVPIHCSSEAYDCGFAPVTCMAATKQLLIVGTMNGEIRMRMMGTP